MFATFLKLGKRRVEPDLRFPLAWLAKLAESSRMVAARVLPILSCATLFLWRENLRALGVFAFLRSIPPSSTVSSSRQHPVQALRIQIKVRTRRRETVMFGNGRAYTGGTIVFEFFFCGLYVKCVT